MGTKASYTVEDIEDYLGKIILSRFNDYLGDNLDTLFNLPGRYDEISAGLSALVQKDFSHFGIELSGLFINSITPPQEVQQAIDDKSRLAMFDDLNKLLKMKTAMAMESAARNPSQAGAGLGMGLGFMMPAMYAENMKALPAGGQRSNALNVRTLSHRTHNSARHAGTTCLLFPNALIAIRTFPRMHGSVHPADARSRKKQEPVNALNADMRTFTARYSATIAGKRSRNDADRA